MADALLRLFGPPRLEAADGGLHELPNNVPGWLAAWLVLHGDWAPRETVALVFWPDRPEAAALHNLRANLHRLRAWLDGAGLAAALETDKRRVRLALASDSARFRRACAAARWDDALACAGGPLLQGLSLAGMPAVDAWCQAQREQFATAVRGAVREQATRWQAEGRAADAVALLTQELERDPLAEELLQVLLRLAPHAGAEAAALAAFDRCARRAAEELGQAPLPATVALVEALRGRPRPAAPAPFDTAPVRSLPARLATPPLAGRAADLGWLQTAARQPGLLLLRGEPGVGKTRLVESALPKALWWSCRPGDGLAAPLQPVADFLQDQLGSLREHPAVQRHRARLARLVTELQADEADAVEAAAPDAGLLAALAELFHALGRAVVVDDLQWADAQTLALIEQLLHARQLPLVATLRSHEATPALAQTLARWQAGGAVQAHELAPLSAPALEQWVADLSGQPGGAPRFAQWLHARSAGNPLFALETLRTLFAEGRLRADGDGWHSALDGLAAPDYDTLTLPPRVAETVRLRLATLAPATQRVLRLCAVTGEALWLEPLAALAQVPTAALGEALGEAQQAGVLHGRRFAHELLRQAVLEPVPEAERAAIHAGWLQLAGDRLTPHARALHAWAAGDRAAAVDATVAASTLDAQRGLHAAADERLADALARIAAGPSGDAEGDAAARAALLARRARVRLEQDRLEAAAADAEAALAEDPGPATRADALSVLGDVALLQGRVADVPALAAAALEAVPGHDMALMLRVKWSHAQGDFATAEATLRERLAGLRRAPAGAALVDALASLGAVIDHQGRHAEALPLHREALALARRRGLRYAEVSAASNLLWCLPELGLHDEAVAVGEAAVALGDFDATPTLVNNLAWLHLDQGRLDDAARLYRRLVDTDDLAVRCSARAKLLQIDASQGRPVDAASQSLLESMRQTDHPQGRAIGALALLDHGPPALHATAAGLAPTVPVDPSLQARLDAALARRGFGR